MEAATIFNILSKHEYAGPIFSGVYARDVLFHLNPTFPSAFVINTATSKYLGEHWVAIYYDRRGTAFFFYSLTLPVLHRDFKIFLRQTPHRIIFNTRRLQSYQSSTCGHFCILFLLLCARGFSMRDILSIFHENAEVNDLAVKIFINQKYETQQPYVL